MSNTDIILSVIIIIIGVLCIVGVIWVGVTRSMKEYGKAQDAIDSEWCEIEEFRLTEKRRNSLCYQLGMRDK